VSEQEALLAADPEKVQIPVVLARSGLAERDLAAEKIEHLLRAPHDHPANLPAQYTVAFLPRKFPLPRAPRSCPHLRGKRCRQLRASEVRYLHALAQFSSFSEAAAVTADRFSGAVAAHDRTAADLQQRTEAQYLPEQRRALSKVNSTARAFAHLIRSDHLDVTIPARQVAKARTRFTRLKGIPAATINRLERDGLIRSRTDLKRIISSILKPLPPPRSTTLAKSLLIPTR